MLQLETAGYKTLGQLRSQGEFPPRWSKIEELERLTDSFMERFRQERFEVSKELGAGFVVSELIEQMVRTGEREHMDDETKPGDERLESVRALDRMNRMTLAYEHQCDLLMPLIEELGRAGKPVSILELAAGSGGLTFALAERVLKAGINVRITASDIVPAMIDEGNRQAAERSLPVSFRRLNAFDFEGIERGSVDLVLISQSLHHFTPGQLALMIAQAQRHGAAAFVGLDGFRSLLLIGGVPLVASLQGIGEFTLDGLTSARKFYSGIELDIIAAIATGKEAHRVSCSWPMTVLHVPLKPPATGHDW
ncbi:class I SAM-dependent methyltransferase [Chlorobaculum sp. MV4-Y]|jgi:SAM-dependent methyltransferase|uniref:class I SAM-dependent methyltransferase n=1 Tax=Chlorobaculum sp. MV4-Y TaxID=2976335 RepID=UPI0021AF1A21|nr:class I SAM-dependent methyltransferase [Chlorobaculum sp. MV4-Y]UWX58075.1 class I SAM-dependent methyltransferase [Chlorobaculum sp. MV4-Y]